VIVLGIDPGSRHFGWGVVAREGTRLRHVAHGVIEAERPGDSFADRLVIIERELVRVVRTHRPTCASVEGLFFAKDAQAASKLGHARGVALLVCARERLAVAEYPPARVKRTVAGGGRADKQQVAKMICVILGLGAVPASDAADALALAVTHLSRSPLLASPLPASPAPLRHPALFVAKRPPRRGIHGRKASTV
jgi:crossover junction endodeoxyribonuclease RuvC